MTYPTVLRAMTEKELEKGKKANNSQLGSKMEERVLAGIKTLTNNELA